ncbi:MAG: hypothetical protein MZV64_16945 [Ignavibacteriales bacterium]|nr:hypothetical protein [Ignavibacteriales bacterium]
MRRSMRASLCGRCRRPRAPEVGGQGGRHRVRAPVGGKGRHRLPRRDGAGDAASTGTGAARRPRRQTAHADLVSPIADPHGQDAAHGGPARTARSVRAW